MWSLLASPLCIASRNNQTEDIRNKSDITTLHLPVQCHLFHIQ